MSHDFHYSKGPNLTRVLKVQNHVSEVLQSLDWDDNAINVSKNWVLMHFMTVSQVAHILALHRGVDTELATVAGLLHDIGLIQNRGMTKDHAPNGYQPAKDILQVVGGFTDQEIELIADAVKHHSEKDKVGNWLEELVKDADIFDCALHASDYRPFEHHYARQQKVAQEFGLPLPFVPNL